MSHAVPGEGIRPRRGGTSSNSPWRSDTDSTRQAESRARAATRPTARNGLSVGSTRMTRAIASRRGLRVSGGGTAREVVIREDRDRVRFLDVAMIAAPREGENDRNL